MIQMVSNYIYIFCFSNLFVCHTYIYSIGPTQKSVEYHFLAISEVFETAEAVFTGHVGPMARTYPTSRTCPTPGPDMSESQVSSLYKGAERPHRTLGLFFSSTPSLARS
jgi:hypothetical protein